MLREGIICIVIVIMIFIGNIVTQNYTKSSVEELSKNLEELRIDLEKENNEKAILDKIDKVNQEWRNRHDKLAYYIEHKELELVETNMTVLKSFIETKEYKEAINELDKSVFELKHIQDKYAFNLENVL